MSDSCQVKDALVTAADVIATAARMNCAIKSLVEQLDDIISAHGDYGLLVALNTCISASDAATSGAAERVDRAIASLCRT